MPSACLGQGVCISVTRAPTGRMRVRGQVRLGGAIRPASPASPASLSTSSSTTPHAGMRALTSFPPDATAHARPLACSRRAQGTASAQAAWSDPLPDRRVPMPRA